MTYKMRNTYEHLWETPRNTYEKIIVIFAISHSLNWETVLDVLSANSLLLTCVWDYMNTCHQNKIVTSGCICDYYVFHGRVTLFFANNSLMQCLITFCSISIWILFHFLLLILSCSITIVQLLRLNYCENFELAWKETIDKSKWNMSCF